jgi:spermidine synthase
MNGLHLIADLYSCAGDMSVLTERDRLERLCINECNEAGLQPLGTCFYQFVGEDGRGAGVTGAVVLAESHLAIHTWPEIGGVTLDVYVCNFSRDNSTRARSLYRAVIDALQPGEVVEHELIRGRAKARA